jgi:hypothetical protein
MGSCLPLGITYPCFTRDGTKRKAAKGLRINIGVLCDIVPADHSLSLNTAVEVNFEVALKNGCSAFAWIGCEIVGMYSGRWFASSLCGRGQCIHDSFAGKLKLTN